MKYRYFKSKVIFYNPASAFLEFISILYYVRSFKEKSVLISLRNHINLYDENEIEIKTIQYQYKFTQILLLIFNSNRFIFEDIDTRSSFMRYLYKVFLKNLMLNNDFLEFIQYFGESSHPNQLKKLYLFSDEFEKIYLKKKYNFDILRLHYKYAGNITKIRFCPKGLSTIFIGTVTPNKYHKWFSKHLEDYTSQINIPQNHFLLFRQLLPNILSDVEKSKFSLAEYFLLKHYFVNKVRERALARLSDIADVKFYGISDSYILPKFGVGKLSVMNNEIIVDAGSKCHTDEIYERTLVALGNSNKVLSICFNETLMYENA